MIPKNKRFLSSVSIVSCSDLESCAPPLCSPFLFREEHFPKLWGTHLKSRTPSIWKLLPVHPCPHSGSRQDGENPGSREEASWGARDLPKKVRAGWGGKSQGRTESSKKSQPPEGPTETPPGTSGHCKRGQSLVSRYPPWKRSLGIFEVPSSTPSTTDVKSNCFQRIGESRHRNRYVTVNVAHRL